MPTALDLAANLTGASVTEGQAKTWFTAMRAALAEMGDPMAQFAIQNLSLAFTVGSNALTCNVKTRAGAAPSATDPVSVAMRNATLATGDFNIRNITAALSLVVSAGSTLGFGTASGAKSLYWYVIDNAGTLELAVSLTFFGTEGIVSTTAEGGAGGADTGTLMYSATARSNVPFRCIGRTKDSQTTPGTWVNVPTSVELAPFNLNERGLWTPGIAFGGGTTGLTYSVQFGRWLKSADLVTVFALIVLANKGSSAGNAAVTGLPFRVRGSSNPYTGHALVNWQNLTTAILNMTAWGVQVGFTATLQHLTAAATNWSNTQDTDFANNTNVTFSFSYLTDE